MSVTHSNQPETLLEPEERVLSTLEADGRRRWLHPRLSKGRFWSARRVVAYALIAFFTVLPWTTINGKPPILLNIAAREFTFFGFTFLPTDTLLLALFMLSVFLSIFFITAVLGRIWCGWGCPQTVYMEFVFRPIQRVFMGKSGVGGPPKKGGVAGWRYITMYVVYLLICAHLANTFLAYFVGVENLKKWIWSFRPWEQPTAFIVFFAVTGLMMFDFAYWREQLCIIGCPYGRFQSVLLDRWSMIISYDRKRGEPRGKPRPRKKGNKEHVTLPVLGDCIDCSMCVTVCPTGIDIRQGLQLECIGCAQCIDACDDVMRRVGRPTGLIRYSSQACMDGAPKRLIRPRVILYPSIVIVLMSLFTYTLVNKPTSDLTLLRERGLPFMVQPDGRVENRLKLRIVNRTGAMLTYTLSVAEPSEGVNVLVDGDLRAEPGQTAEQHLHVYAEPVLFRGGVLEVSLRVTDHLGAEQVTRYKMQGPRTAKQP